MFLLFYSKVALHAKRFSQYAAAKIFGVARRRIFDWMRQIPKLEELIAKGHMKKMTGRGPRNRDIDRALYDWYCQKREGGEIHNFSCDTFRPVFKKRVLLTGERPKSAAVQTQARQVYAAHGYEDMKCSYGWFKRYF